VHIPVLDFPQKKPVFAWREVWEKTKYKYTGSLVDWYPFFHNNGIIHVLYMTNTVTGQLHQPCLRYALSQMKIRKRGKAQCVAPDMHECYCAFLSYLQTGYATAT